MFYTLLKFIHVTGAIVWVGGSIVLGTMTLRVLYREDRAALVHLLRQNAFVGQILLGPSAGVTLLAGLGMMAIAWHRPTLWIAWGFIGLFVSMFIGAVLMRRELEVLAPGAAEAADPLRVRSRLTTATAVNAVLLLSTVAAMVFKPTL